MDIWIQTSGKRCDYRFLGYSQEPARWWAPYLDYSAPEQRMFVCETSAQGWRLYVTAMPAGRFDSASPPREIRMSLLADGSPHEAGILERLLFGWLGDNTLALALRQILPELQVEQWLALNGPVPAGQLEGVHAAIAALRVPEGNLEDVASLQLERQGNLRVASHKVARIAVNFAREGKAGVFCQLNLLDDGEEPRGISALADSECLGLVYGDGKEGQLISMGKEASNHLNPTLAGGPKTPTPTGPLTVPGILMGALLLGLIMLIYMVLIRS